MMGIFLLLSASGADLSFSSNPFLKLWYHSHDAASHERRHITAARGEQLLAFNHPFNVTQGQPLLAYLFDVLGQGARAVKNLLKFGAMRVNGVTVRQFDHLLSAGDQVTVGNLRAAAASRSLARARIRPVYEDDTLIVVDKPSGLLTVATGAKTQTPCMFA